MFTRATRTTASSATSRFFAASLALVAGAGLTATASAGSLAVGIDGDLWRSNRIQHVIDYAEAFGRHTGRLPESIIAIPQGVSYRLIDATHFEACTTVWIASDLDRPSKCQTVDLKRETGLWMTDEEFWMGPIF